MWDRIYPFKKEPVATNGWGTSFGFVSAPVSAPAVPMTGTTKGEFVGPLQGWNVVSAPLGMGNDATFDLQEAINSVIANSSGQSVVYLPAGTYRITSTLMVVDVRGLTIVGEDPTTTILVWDGAADGELLHLSNVGFSSLKRLTLDGNSGNAGTLVHSLRTDTSPYVNIANEFSELVFQDATFGLRTGDMPSTSSAVTDTLVDRCKFSGLTAGVALQNDATLGWSFLDCMFTGNEYGITNLLNANQSGLGAGDFNVYRCLFDGNTVADISTGTVSNVTAIECQSRNSEAFFHSEPTQTQIGTYKFLRNVARTASIPISFGVDGGPAKGTPGSILLIDNQLSSEDTGASVALFNDTVTYTDVVSVGNLYGYASALDVRASAKRVLAINDSVGYVTVPNKTFAGFSSKVSRLVYEVTTPVTTAKIQQAIDAAHAVVSKALVHIPYGTHSLSGTVNVPANSDISVVGDGGHAASGRGTVLAWGGTAHEPIITVSLPNRARLVGLGLDGANIASHGVKVQGVDQNNGNVLLNQLYLVGAVSGSTNLRLEELANTQVNAISLQHSDSVGPSVRINDGRLLVLGGSSFSASRCFDLVSDGQLVAFNHNYHRGASNALVFTGSGNATIFGGRYAPNQADGLRVTNHIGRVSMMGIDVRSDGITDGSYMTLTGATSDTKVGLICSKYSANLSPPVIIEGYPDVLIAGTSKQRSDNTVAPLSNLNLTNEAVLTHLADVRASAVPVLAEVVAGTTDMRLNRLGIKQVTTTGVEITGTIAPSTEPGTPPGTVETWIVRDTDPPVAVPEAFVGIHFNRNPNGDPESSDPTFDFGTVRSRDYDPAGSGGADWFQLEPNIGDRELDDISAWSTKWSAKQRIWNFWGTPAWAASGTTPGPYNIPGSNTPPSNYSYVNGIIGDVLDTTGIQVIEIWNEPEPHPDYATYGWINGTPQDLADLTVAIANAVGSRNVSVIGPAFTDINGYVDGKIQAYGAALGSNKSLLDGFSWHWYDGDGEPATTAARLHQACGWLKQMVNEGFGYLPPLWLTEIGSELWNAGDQWSDQEHADAVSRWLLVAAAHGMRTCNLYMYENWMSGNIEGVSVVQDVIDAVHHNVAGGVIRQAAILTDGSVWIEMLDGTTMLDGVATLPPGVSSKRRYMFFTILN